MTKSEEINPDIVIDFMGQGMVAQGWYNPEDWYETNISNKSKLANSSEAQFKKYIRIGTLKYLEVITNLLAKTKVLIPLPLIQYLIAQLICMLDA